MGKLKVNLLGANFSVSAQEDSEYLTRLLDYYSQITKTFQNSGKIKDPLKISILSGIALVDELYNEKKKNAELEQKLKTDKQNQAEKITDEIIKSLDKVL